MNRGIRIQLIECLYTGDLVFRSICFPCIPSVSVMLICLPTFLSVRPVCRRNRSSHIKSLSVYLDMKLLQYKIPLRRNTLSVSRVCLEAETDVLNVVVK